jgi:ferredoxin-NADP reductase
MNLKKLTTSITSVRDVSPTAREITLALPEALGFVAGAFVNTFFDVNGETIRRAYSISSDEREQTTITLTIRKVPGGKASEFFWRSDVVGLPITLMGPLGINTADKLTHRRLFLFGFGIGISVIMAMLKHAHNRSDIDEIVVITGARDETESIYNDEIQSLVTSDDRITYRCVLSQPKNPPTATVGYIQDHLEGLSFDNADVYICGHKVACDALAETIQNTHPQGCVLHVEAFG